MIVATSSSNLFHYQLSPMRLYHEGVIFFALDWSSAAQIGKSHPLSCKDLPVP